MGVQELFTTTPRHSQAPLEGPLSFIQIRIQIRALVLYIYNTVHKVYPIVCIRRRLKSAPPLIWYIHEYQS